MRFRYVTNSIANLHIVPLSLRTGSRVSLFAGYVPLCCLAKEYKVYYLIRIPATLWSMFLTVSAVRVNLAVKTQYTVLFDVQSPPSNWLYRLYFLVILITVHLTKKTKLFLYALLRMKYALNIAIDQATTHQQIVERKSDSRLNLLKIVRCQTYSKRPWKNNVHTAFTNESLIL